jgi:hypothetical protein
MWSIITINEKTNRCNRKLGCHLPKFAAIMKLSLPLCREGSPCPALGEPRIRHAEELSHSVLVAPSLQRSQAWDLDCLFAKRDLAAIHDAGVRYMVLNAFLRAAHSQ